MWSVSVLVRTMVCVLCATACLSSFGCGGGNTLPVVPVTGKVTFQGKPLAGASIAFIPSESEEELTEMMTNARPAAEVDAEGGYELRFNDVEGAPPGKYGVMVFAFKGPAGSDSDDEPPPESLIPTRYNNSKTSGLTAVVKESGENVFDFNLDQ